MTDIDPRNGLEAGTDAPREPQDIDEVILYIQGLGIVLAKDKEGYQKARYADLVQVNEVVLKELNALQTTWVCTPHLNKRGVFGLRYRLRHLPSKTQKKGLWPLTVGDSQKMGSQITYARRYSLLPLLGIVAEGEDDDGAAASGQRTVQRRQPAATSPARATVARTRPAGPPLPGEAPDPLARARMDLHILLTNLGMNETQRREWIIDNSGHAIESTKELTADELAELISKAKAAGGQ